MMKPVLTTIAAVAALTACGDREVVVGEDYQRVLDPLARDIDKLDVLFVIDTSASMQPEQQALVNAAGAQLFDQLELDLGGLPDLRLAVINTDVVLDYRGVAGCLSEDGRDNGRFRIGTRVAGCPAIDGHYLVDEDDGAGGRRRNYEGSLAEAFACAASLEIGSGCGFEHPLEAARRAFDGRYPEQLEFLRSEAMLLVVFITDEDDCSASSGELFGDASGGLDSPLGPRDSFRCFEFGVVCDDDQPRVFGEKSGCRPREDSPYLTPIETYRAFLAGLKPDPSLVMVTGMYAPPTPVVVGQDPAVTARPGTPAVLANCTAPATEVEATPAIRLDALVQQFPSRFVFESMCESEMSQRLYRIARSTAGVMSRSPCLLGNVDITTTTERCRAFDVAPDGSQRVLSGCRTTSEQGCFHVGPSQSCGYTPHGVAARYRGTLADGHRLVVDCLAPVGR